MERHSRVERKFFISADQARAVVGGQTQAGDLGEGRVKVFQVLFQGDLGLFGFGDGVLGAQTKGGPQATHAGHDTTNAGYGVDRVPITTLGPLGLIQKGNIGLRDLGLDVLQPDVHGAHRNGEVLKAGQEVEEVVGGQGEFGRLDILRRELQCPKGQSRGQCQRRGGKGAPGARGGAGGLLWGTGILGLAPELQSICQCFLMRANKAGEVLNRDEKTRYQ